MLLYINEGIHYNRLEGNILGQIVLSFLFQFQDKSNNQVTTVTILFEYETSL